MKKPDGICIFPKNHFDEAFHVQTTDIIDALNLFTHEYGYGYDLADMTINFFYEGPYGKVYWSDPFGFE